MNISDQIKVIALLPKQLISTSLLCLASSILTFLVFLPNLDCAGADIEFSNQSPRIREFERLIDEYETARTVYQNLTSDFREDHKIVDPYRVHPSIFFDFAKRDIDEASILACEYIVYENFHRSQIDHIVDFVVDNHLETPEIGVFLGSIVKFEDWGKQVDKCLQKAMLSTNQNTRYHALYQQAQLLIKRRDIIRLEEPDRYDHIFSRKEIAHFRDHSDPIISRLLRDVLKAPLDMKYRGIPLAELARRQLYDHEKLVPGLPMPEILGVDLNGNPMKLTDFRGEMIVIQYWKRRPNDNEHVERFLQSVKGRPIVWLGIGQIPPASNLKNQAIVDQLSYRSWYDGTFEAIDKFKPNQHPIEEQLGVVHDVLLVIDHNGIILYNTKYHWDEQDKNVVLELLEKTEQELEVR